jgi:hypothetical protein
MMSVTRWRQALPWLLLLAIGVAAAWLRYRLIEPSIMVELCGGSHNPAWCSWRLLLVLGFQHHAYGVSVYGVAALAAAMLALLWKRAWAAWLAAALGAFALELYCFEPGALALLIGCLCLLRIQAQVLPRVAPAEQHRQRDQQIQSQP